MREAIELTESEIERFKEAREKYINIAMAEGFNAGSRWAKLRATYGELVLLKRKLQSEGAFKWPDTMQEFFRIIDNEGGYGDLANWMSENDKLRCYLENENFAGAFVNGVIETYYRLESAD